MNADPGTAASIALLAVAVCTAGCDVRDEVAVAARASRWWPAADPAAGGPPLIGAAAGATATLPVEYVEGFEAGRRRAAEGGQPMLVIFRAAWCRWSGEFVQALASDARLVALSRRFVCVTVDADRDLRTCTGLGVDTFPTVLLFDAEGTERFRAAGASASDRLALAMRGLLDPHTADRPGASGAGAARR